MVLTAILDTPLSYIAIGIMLIINIVYIINLGRKKN